MYLTKHNSAYSFFTMYKGKSYTRRYKKVRYSNETTCIICKQDVASQAIATYPTYTGASPGFVLVPSADLQGTRKVKNMTISLSSTGNSTPILCTVVYVPQGTTPSSINHSATTSSAGVSLYEPNQNVIMQFVLNPVVASGAGSECLDI